MAQRNYPCDNIIDVYWGKQDFSQTGEAAFKKQLYQCLIGQALEMKGDIEVRRSTNEWGKLVSKRKQEEGERERVGEENGGSRDVLLILS
jgi:hypothetical protein